MKLLHDGIGSKVGFVPIFNFFSFPVLRARYSLPVTVASRFESLTHVMTRFQGCQRIEFGLELWHD